MTDTCLFCKLIAGEIKSNIVYQDDNVFAFRDINPQAPVHILVIPKRHIATLNEVRPEDTELMGQLLVAATRIARDEGVAEEGYRTVINCNRHGGQVVFHIHVHILGGRGMHWPPG
jgi:histidine triad (HIT) family protein